MGVWTSPKDKLTPEQQAKQKKITKVVRSIVLGIFVFLGLIMVVVAAGGGSSFSTEVKKERKDRITEFRAYSITRDLIKDHVEKEYPDVDFPFDDYKFKKIQDGGYLIISYFDYTNKFGGKERYYYSAIIQYNSGKWEEKKNWTLVSVSEYDKSKW